MLRSLIGLILVVILSACVTTTATYGAKFNPIEGKESIYSFKVAYGGTNFGTSSIEKSTRKKVIRAADNFVNENVKYTSYEIIGFKRVLVPSMIVYQVLFN